MRNYRILVIDDEADFTLLLKNYLTRLGHTVTTAGSIGEGMEKVEEFNPEILFLDNHLPDGLGWQQVPALKEKMPSLQINLMSAYYTHLAHLQRYPDVKFIEKPLGLKAISSLLKAEVE